MRELVCIDCDEVIELYEEPREFVDPERFRCGTCLAARPSAPHLAADPPAEQLTLETNASGRRTETRKYDPAQAAIPF